MTSDLLSQFEPQQKQQQQQHQQQRHQTTTEQFYEALPQTTITNKQFYEQPHSPTKPTPPKTGKQESIETSTSPHWTPPVLTETEVWDEQRLTPELLEELSEAQRLHLMELVKGGECIYQTMT